jgi:hypothetical protein
MRTIPATASFPPIFSRRQLIKKSSQGKAAGSWNLNRYGIFIVTGPLRQSSRRTQIISSCGLPHVVLPVAVVVVAFLPGGNFGPLGKRNVEKDNAHCCATQNLLS